MTERYTGPAMDIANMRANGAGALVVTCLGCNHSATVLADHLPGDLPVPLAARRFRCSKCGSKRIETRPDWPVRRKGG